MMAHKKIKANMYKIVDIYIILQFYFIILQFIFDFNFLVLNNNIYNSLINLNYIIVYHILLS